MMGYGYGFGPAGFLFMLLWWAVIIVGIVALVRWLLQSGGRQKDDGALAILQERFVKGEIDRKEFEERKKHLLA